MGDPYIQAAIRAAGLEVAVAVTTSSCRDARRSHTLASTPAIALGRLLTATALVALTSKRRGSTSFQIISTGRLRQVYADATHTGDLRGFSKNTQLHLPISSPEEKFGRRFLQVALLPGKLSVVRADGDGAFTQSTVDMTAGEVDIDVEHFLEKSDQIPTALACEVLLGEGDEIDAAAGVLVQAMPGGDVERLAKIRTVLREKSFADRVRACNGDAMALLASTIPDAELVEHPRTVQWKCRCSKEKVINALRMLHPSELVSMVQSGEPAKVGCDLCGTQYLIAPPEIETILVGMTTAEG